MKRRERPPPPDAPPPELLEFRVEDWDDGAPSPLWWGEGSSMEVPWRYFHARRRCEQARAQWRQAHGIDLYEWDRLRGACTDACQQQRPYQHVHGG